MQLREFLDKSSGILTAFGVLTALAIYASTTLKEQNEYIAYTLSFSFWLMSCIIWFEFLRLIVIGKQQCALFGN